MTTLRISTGERVSYLLMGEGYSISRCLADEKQFNLSLSVAGPESDIEIPVKVRLDGDDWVFEAELPAGSTVTPR